MEIIDFILGPNVSLLASLFLVGFYLLFSLLYIIYSIVYLQVVKALNRTVKTPQGWFFELVSVVQVVLSLFVLLLGLSLIF